ncbi:MAG: hypothetical protein Ct9H300mP3_09200 [Gammaproteobacteria bacterium]|nr:MAG: hypothetical protein Ct9H300mP3_09200 [Gammaproteobacteria bacterium]
MQFLTRIAKWITLALVSLLACTLVLFLIFLIMDIFGVSGEDVSNNLLDHRILLILLAFASMVVSYFYLYKNKIYSYCKATAGSSLAALLAGQIPKNRPTQAEKVIEPRIAKTGTTKGSSENEAAKK